MKAVQLRMARAALGWGVRELAKKAGVTANTVTRIELGADAKQSTIEALQRTLEAAGIEFIPQNGGGPGVRLRNPVVTHHQGSSKPWFESKAPQRQRTRPRKQRSQSTNEAEAPRRGGLAGFQFWRTTHDRAPGGPPRVA